MSKISRQKIIINLCSACLYLAYIQHEIDQKKILVLEKIIEEKQSAQTQLYTEFYDEIVTLSNRIQNLDNKIDTIEWKIDPRSDPSLWNQPDGDRPENDT